MNIYLLSQTECRGYDSYDSAVVIAESKAAARLVHPSRWRTYTWTGFVWRCGDYTAEESWPDPQYVEVTLLGVANPDAKPGVVCASFNAG